MATMTEPKAEQKTLVHYMVESGVAILELDDPPANTYTHEMMRQLDDAILRARFELAHHFVGVRVGRGVVELEDRDAAFDHVVHERLLLGLGFRHRSHEPSASVNRGTRLGR